MALQPLAMDSFLASMRRPAVNRETLITVLLVVAGVLLAVGLFVAGLMWRKASERPAPSQALSELAQLFVLNG